MIHKSYIGVGTLTFGGNLAEKGKGKAKQKFYGVRVPADVSAALIKAVKEGKGLNEAEYIRDAIRKKLREDGLL